MDAATGMQVLVHTSMRNSLVWSAKETSCDLLGLSRIQIIICAFIQPVARLRELKRHVSISRTGLEKLCKNMYTRLLCMSQIVTLSGMKTVNIISVFKRY